MHIPCNINKLSFTQEKSQHCLRSPLALIVDSLLQHELVTSECAMYLPILLSYLSYLFRLQLLSEDYYLLEGLQSSDKTKTHPKAKLQNAPTFTGNGSHSHGIHRNTTPAAPSTPACSMKLRPASPSLSRWTLQLGRAV